MFLDEELYQCVKNTPINSGTEFVKLLEKCYSICGNKLTPKIYKGITFIEIRTLFNNVFNSWDLFVKRLERENNESASLFKEYPYKKQLLSNNDVNRIYNLNR